MKHCTGYRDTSQLQIQDESEAVRQKAERVKVGYPATQPDFRYLAAPNSSTAAQASPACIPTPLSMSSDGSSGSDSTTDTDPDDTYVEQAVVSLQPAPGGVTRNNALFGSISETIRLKPNDIATTYFFRQFTSTGQWEYIRNIARQPQLDPCLNLAIQACGMAALTNVELVPAGRAYAQSSYVEALGLLNQALRDSKRSRSDEALIAVSMLGYYENIACDSHQSMESWKAHIAGATQMLKLRGRAQFKSHIGRILFRELRAQILIACLWDDREAPAFLEEYQPDLAAHTLEDFTRLGKVADDLTTLFFRFARLRTQLITGAVTDQRGVEAASELECDLIQWAADAVESSGFWQYYELDVFDSEHVWDGKVYAFAGNPAPTIWNQWRILRIMLSRSQEMLCRRMSVSADALAEQQVYFRRMRRQMTDETCRTIPACLGHASPAFSSPCVLITAYASIWSLFFSATVLVERVGPDAKYILWEVPHPLGKPQTAAYAQLAWVMGRLRYIAQVVGLRWADGIAAVLRGEVQMRQKQAEDE